LTIFISPSLKRSSEFYKKMLEPLGIDMPYKLDHPPLRGFAINSIPGFWLKNGEVAKDLYVAFKRLDATMQVTFTLRQTTSPAPTAAGSEIEAALTLMAAIRYFVLDKAFPLIDGRQAFSRKAMSSLCMANAPRAVDRRASSLA
jgi:hypothetical protein